MRRWLAEGRVMSAMLMPPALGRRAVLRATGGLIAIVSARAARAGPETQVAIDNFTFSPALLTVSPGTTVTWVNRDDIPHSIVCLALGLKSHAMDTDQTFSCRVDRAGRFEYFCGIHPHMKGEIMVSA
jgi:plastocyanin